jgi:pheromone shutdown protein TraB
MVDTILIGTVHVDHKGHERLEKMLNHLRPSIVCLEHTPKTATNGWKMHQDLMKKWAETPWHKIYTPEQIARVKSELMSTDYEDWVPKVYKNGSPAIRLMCLDKELTPELSGSLSYQEQLWVTQQMAEGKSMSDLLTPVDMSITDFAERGSEEEHKRYVDNEYEKTSPTEFISRYGYELFRIAVLERDRNFAKQIQELRNENPDRTILATLGNMHIFGDYAGSTYDLLSGINPKRFKLKEADTL